MKKVLKNILKWLLCVCISFSVIFTILQFKEIATGLYFRTLCFGNIEQFEEVFGEESLSEMIKGYDEITNEQFLKSDVNTDDIMSKLYAQYPAGVTRIACIIANYISYGDTTIISLMLGVIIGTAIYMLIDIDKKGIKIVIPLYILSVVILGFVQGFINISLYNGATLSLLERWMFPDEYIVPVTIVFGLVVIVRFIKQKGIANKLNEKLKERKEEKNK